MREYRGKRLDGKGWVKGWYRREYDDHIIQPNCEEGESDYMAYPVDPSTVGQYTGLKDKNGKEIYEGDILKIPDLYETPENTSMTYHNEVVFYHNCAYHSGDNPLYDDADYISDECEVIGSIHDNPELLEAE